MTWIKVLSEVLSKVSVYKGLHNPLTRSHWKSVESTVDQTRSRATSHLRMPQTFAWEAVARTKNVLRFLLFCPLLYWCVLLYCIVLNSRVIIDYCKLVRKSGTQITHFGLIQLNLTVLFCSLAQSRPVLSRLPAERMFFFKVVTSHAEGVTNLVATGLFLFFFFALMLAVWTSSDPSKWQGFVV